MKKNALHTLFIEKKDIQMPIFMYNSIPLIRIWISNSPYPYPQSYFLTKSAHSDSCEDFSWFNLHYLIVVIFIMVIIHG